MFSAYSENSFSGFLRLFIESNYVLCIYTFIADFNFCIRQKSCNLQMNVINHSRESDTQKKEEILKETLFYCSLKLINIFKLVVPRCS